MNDKKDTHCRVNKTWMLLLILSCCFYTIESYAGCAFDINGTFSNGFNNVIVQRDTPVGREIATISMNNSGYTWSDGTCGSHVIMTYNGAKPTSLEHTFETNIPGVGIQFSDSDNAGNYFASISPGTLMHAGTVYGAGGSFMYNGVIHLIKTGPIVSGNLDAGEVAQISLISTNGTEYERQRMNLTGGTVTQVLCSITTPQLTFTLGDVPAFKFGSATGPAPADTEKTENLGLECDAGANINVSLAGTQNPDDSQDSILALTGQGDAGVAQGVGVQLLYNGTPLELNKNIVLKKSAGGQETFPIVARYYQTKTTVMPGKANALATLNISYQ